MFIKYFLDRVFSLFIILLLLPLLFLVAVFIKLDSKGSILFIQERAGRNGELFRIYKFRTMIPNAVNMGTGVYTEENDPRITRFGKFLRKTSLDELPQLFNILKGDMSFIGPRPTLEEQVLQYDDFQKQRLRMKPGITGFAQVNGRNSISWPERIKLDVAYIENWTIWLDIKILFKTFFVVFKKEGLYGKEENFVIQDKSSKG